MSKKITPENCIEELRQLMQEIPTPQGEGGRGAAIISIAYGYAKRSGILRDALYDENGKEFTPDYKMIFILK
jgi:hypothetical protein